MKKRVLSILLTLCMVTQLMPTAALAEQVEAVSSTSTFDSVAAVSDLASDQDVTGEEGIAGLADDEAAINAVLETGDHGSEPALTSTESTHIHRVCGESNCTDSEQHPELEWTAWDKADSLPSEEPGDTYYYLTQDVTLSSTWYVNFGYTVNLCLNGHTITGPNGDSAITIAGGQLVITDCHTGDAAGKITHKSGETGNGVSVNAGRFTMWNGSITGNTAGFGAGVANYALFNMYGGSITGNYVNDKAVFDGFGGGVYNAARIYVSGSATITGNIGKDGSADNVHLVKKARIRVDDAGMSGGAKVGVNGDDPASNPTVVDGSTDTAVFASDNANYVLQSNGNGGLRIASAHQHSICGDTDCGDEDHDNVEWAMWTSNNSLPTESGNYYLTADVTLSDSWMVDSDIKLCLNGHTITGANGKDVAYVSSGSSLTITDCKDTAMITHAQGASGGGITNDGTLLLWGGSICDNTVSSSGAGVRNTGTFTMAGGSIENDKAIGNGAGVSNSGTFVMTGGKICGNAITGAGRGAGVYNNGADFQICGDAQITGNADKNNASSNVYLIGGKTITAIGELGANASIGISLPSYEASPVVVTGVSDASAANHFFVDDNAHMIEADGSGNLRLATHKHRVCGENSCDDDSHGATLTWIPVSSLDEISSNGNYYLTGNVTRSNAWTCQYNVNLCLDGHTITAADGNNAILVMSGANLTITDCHSGDEAGKITHAEGATGGAIENNGTLTLWGGQICGNSSDYGAAVYNLFDATFTMRGGSITDNTALWGGGVRNNGTFTMSGGSIANNSADIAGGGVFNSGTFTIAGDVAIAQNKVGAAPNNVYLSGESVITVQAGTSLSDKASVGITAEKPKSGPTVVTGTTSGTGFAYDDESYQLIANGSNGLKLTSQHIHGVCGTTDCGDEGHGNETWTAWVSGDSLPTTSGTYYLTSDVTLSDTLKVETGVDIKLCLNGCIITGPSGKDAITVKPGANLTVTDCQEAAGQITHEKGQTGNGVRNSGTFTLWGGSIIGNTAADQGQGGGVYNLGTFTMNGGSITGNTAGTQGGGVWNARTFTMSGGYITGNTAANQGGGVYTNTPSYATTADYTTFTMTGGKICGNNVTGGDATGGGLYASGLTYLSGDVEICGNAQGGTIADGQVAGGTPSNVCANRPLAVLSAGMGASAKVGITYVKSAQNPTVVDNTTNTAGFFSDSGSYTLVKNSDNTGLMLAAGHHHAICGQSGCAQNHDENIAWTAWERDDSLPTVAGTYYLTKDVNLSSQWKVSSDITLCLNGKTVTSSYFGSAILVVHDSQTSTYGSLTITDCGSGDSTGKITHASGVRGVAVDNQNDFTLWAGSITGNNGDLGGGVFNQGTFTMNGGSITGNTASNGGAGVYNSGTIIVSGDARITGNTETNGAASNVYLINDNPIEVANGEKPLSAIAKIGITAQHSDSGNNVVNGSTNTGVFASDSDGYELAEGENGGLKLSKFVDLHAHKICGDDTCEDSSHGKLVWKAVSALTDITADGNYYLTGDVKLSDTWTCSYNVNLCLDGHTVTGAAGKDTIKVAEGASLAITDCHTGEKAGKITHDAGDQGRGIHNRGDLVLWNGSVTGNASGIVGGGVYNCGSLAVRGGSITGNTAAYYGGGVYNEGTLKLYGTVNITDNKAGSGDQASASNVCLGHGKVITIENDANLAASSRVGVCAVSPDNGVQAVSGSTSTTVFTSDDNGYELVENGEKTGLNFSAKKVEISGVKLLNVAGGSEMGGSKDAKSKVYDGQAVAAELNGVTATPEVAGATFTCAWQKKSGDAYVDIAGNQAPKDAGDYRLVVSYARGGVVFGTAKIPFAITAKGLTVKSVTVAQKTYDGTASATIAGVELEGVVAGDSVSALASRASFADKNAGANKSVTAMIELTGDASANYTVDADVSGTGTINPKDLVVYAVAGDKTYDGKTEATIWDVWLDGVVAGESGQVSVDTSNMVAAFADSKVGDDKNVTITGLALAGDGKGNYTLPQNVTTDASVYKAAGTGSVVLDGWTYGEKPNEPVVFSYTNTTAGVTYQYKAKDAESSAYTDAVPTAPGEYTVKATFPASGNYEAASVTANFTIAKKELTVKDLAVAEKTYDGTTSAAIAGTPSLDGVVEGDDVSLVCGTPSFASAGAGKNIPVGFTAFSLSGKAAGNYTLAQPTGITATITAKELTITGATVAEKTYDGRADAKVTAVTFDGLVAGETLAFGTDYTVSSAAYDGANATGDGAATKVDFSVKLAETSAAKNYVLNDAKGSQRATIKKVSTSGYAASVTAKPGEQGSCPVYVVPGGSASMSVEDEGDILDGEPSVTNNTLSYKLKANAAEGQTATIKVKVTSANYEDYEVSVTVKVSDKEQVEIELDGEDFTYNGKTQAPSISVKGNKVQVSDLDVTYYDEQGQGSAEAPKAAGTYLMVVSVPDTNPGYTGFAMCAFQIKPKTLTAVALAQSKTYDGTAVAEVTGVSLEGRVDGDEVVAQAISGSFDDKNIGADKDVTVAFELVGKDAGNYTADAMLQTKASITAKELGVTAATKDKAYDGTTDANATAALTGVVAGDDVTASVTSASFADKNAGTGKSVTVGVELSGKDAGNYTAASTAKTTASIAAKQLTIAGATVADKTYDGTTAATVTAVTFGGLVDGESLTFGTDYGVSGARYDGADATGDGAATKAGFSVTLANTATAKNYFLKDAKGSQPATIAKVKTSGYAATDSRKPGEQGGCWFYVVPGGEASVSAVSDEDGILDGEPTVAGNTLSYKLKDGADAGQAATIKVKVASANYEDYEVAVTVEVSDKEQVSIDLAGDEFTYDGSAQAPAISVQDEKVKVDDLVVTYYDESGNESAEAPKAAGTYLMFVSVPDSNNSYTGFAACTFQIAKKNVSVKDLAVADKTYDGTTAATIAGTPSVDGPVAGDDVSLVCGVPTFSSAAVGEGVPVTFTDFSLTGAAAGNYELTQPSGVTASILAYDAKGAEYAATTGDWTNKDFTVTAAEGWKVALSDAADADWRDALTCSDEGEGSLTFYVRNDAEGYISTAVILPYKIDKTAPTGKIEVGEDFWTSFLETVTFGLYRNEKQAVTITGDDAPSGIAKIEYLVTDADLTVDQLAGENFTAYSGSFEVEPDASLIVYARVTDAAGNVTYLRSDGVVLDATAPVIGGADNGRTYCGPVELTVSDANLDSVTLNGATAELVDGKLTVQPAEGTQAVTATDKAGNSTTLTLTVNDGHTWGAWVSNGDGTHTRTCRFDAAHTQTADCHGGTATCVDRAVCDDCGHEYGEVDADNHASLTHVAAKEATTAAEGNTEYWYCVACGKYFSDAAGEHEIQKSDTVIAKLPETPDDKKDDDSDDKKDDEDKKDDSGSDDKDDDSDSDGKDDSDDSTDGKSDDDKSDGEKTDDEKTDDEMPDTADAGESAAKSPAKPKVPQTGDAAAAAALPALLGTATVAAAFVSARKKRDE